MLFTVNVATYNQLDNLKVILQALEQQVFKEFEVSVTDDGSNDGTKEWMEDYATSHAVRYYWYEKDGFQLAKSKNIGIEAANGQYFVSLEGDVIPHKYLLMEYSKAISPDTIVYGTRHDIEFLPDKLDWEALDTSIVAKDFRSAQLVRLGQISNPWRLCSGCNVCFPTKALRDVGGWNEDFRHYGYDDYEICARLYAEGYKIIACPAAYGYHIRHEIHPSIDKNYDILVETERRLGLDAV